MRFAHSIPLIYVGILIAVPLLAVFVMAEERSELCAVLKERSADQPMLRGQKCESISTAEYMCAFAFEFRSDAARELYDRLAHDMNVCSAHGEFATVRTHGAVNHPDSFEQVTFDIFDGPQASVSLKDKGALQKTYVFVRLPAH